VVAVTSGVAKAAYLKDLGADAVIDAAAATKEAPLHKLIRAAAPKGGLHRLSSALLGGGPITRLCNPPPPPPPRPLITGVNVVFDPVGGPLLSESLKTLAWGAQYLIIGFVAGIPKVPANLLLVKNCTVGGGRGGGGFWGGLGFTGVVACELVGWLVGWLVGL